MQFERREADTRCGPPARSATPLPRPMTAPRPTPPRSSTPASVRERVLPHPAPPHGSGAPAAGAPDDDARELLLAELVGHLDATSEMICATDGAGRIVFVNAAWCRALGYTPREAAGLDPMALVAPEHRAPYGVAALRLTRGAVIEDFEAVLLARDGRRVVCRGRAVPRMLGDRCVGTHAAYHDVTAERRAESTRARLVATLEATSDFVGIATTAGEITYLNRAGRRLVGLADDADLSTFRADDLHPPAALARLLSTAVPAALRDGTWEGESVLRSVGGEEIPVSIVIVAHPSTRADEPPYFLSTVMRDVRERAAAERELEASVERDARYRAALDGGFDAFWALRAVRDAAGAVVEFDVLEVNAAAARMVGMARRDLLGARLVALFPAVRDEGRLARYAAVIDRGEAAELELESRDPRIGARWLRVQAVPLGDGLALTIRDISAEKQAEHERRFLGVVLDSISDCISACDADGRLTLFNRATREMHGLAPDAALAPEAWVGRYAVLTPDGRAPLPADALPLVRALARPDEVHDVAFATERSDGRVHSLISRAQAIRGPGGEVLGAVSAARDVTAREAAERALRESEARLSLIYGSASDLMFLMSVEEGGDDARDGTPAPRRYRCESVNAAYLAATGLAESEVVGRVLEEILPAAHAAAVRLKYDEAVADGAVLRYEENVALPTHRLIVETTLTPVRSADGRVTHLLGAARDVTARRAAERERARLGAVLEATTDYVSIADASGTLAYLNQGGADLLGVDAAAAVGAPVEGIYAPAALQRFQDVSRPAALAHGVWQGETCVVTAGGREVPASQVLIAKRDADGRIDFFATILRDLTAQKRVEAALRESEAQFRGVLETLQAAAVCLDTDGVVTFANDALLTLTGWRREDAVGASWFARFMPAGVPAGAVFREGIETGVIRPHWENEIVCRDGTRRRMAWDNVVVRDGDGRVVGTASVGHDVTQATRVRELKDQLIATVSHEVRGPLGAIRGALQLLATGLPAGDAPADARARQMHAMAVRNTERVLRLVNDLLSIERIESGALPLDPAAVHATTLLATAAESLEPAAAAAGVTLVVEAPPGAPDSPADAALVRRPVAWGDPEQLHRVLTNLVGNAIKFTPGGGRVWLSASTDGHEVTFRVRDDGRGIPADRLEAVFDRFEQVHADDAHTKGGAGLGLAICRAIVQQHGGRVWAESALGCGSTFTFTVPTAERALQSAA